MSGQSDSPTRYAVHCRLHGMVFLTKQEYDRQMAHDDSLWKCPVEGCDEAATFDDDNYEYPAALYAEEGP